MNSFLWLLPVPSDLLAVCFLLALMLCPACGPSAPGVL